MGGAADDQAFVFRMRQQPGEAVGELLMRAADQVSTQVQEDLEGRQSLALRREPQPDRDRPVATLSDWLAVKRRLEGCRRYWTAASLP